MLIINADDFGRTRIISDRILICFERETVTSASAMVFMEDSLRASELAKESGLDVGLHVNFTQRNTGRIHNDRFIRYHDQIARFLTLNKLSHLIYNPALRKKFDYVFKVQHEEFERIYGALPSHIDGHHHMHLCANMIFGNIMPKGNRIRRNFTFEPGEKSLLNRFYRSMIDRYMSRSHIMPDYLFSLSDRLKNDRIARVLDLARRSDVELQTHPELDAEFRWLLGQDCRQSFSRLQKGSYSHMRSSSDPQANTRIKGA